MIPDHQSAAVPPVDEDHTGPLEQELRNLRPTPPREAFSAALAGELQRVQTEAANGGAHGVQRTAPGRWPWRALAAAAAFAFAAVFVTSVFTGWDRLAPWKDVVTSPVPQSPKGPDTGVPAAGTNPFERLQQVDYVVDAKTGGVLRTTGGTPVRPVRFQAVHAAVYRDRRDGSTFRVSVPRDEIIFVPVEFY